MSAGGIARLGMIRRAGLIRIKRFQKIFGSDRANGQGHNNKKKSFVSADRVIFVHAIFVFVSNAGDRKIPYSWKSNACFRW